MTQEEISTATYALRDWLQTQEIAPSDGFSVMCRMMAWCMVDKSSDIDDLVKGICAVNDLLEWEIAVIRANKLRDLAQ